VKKIFYHESDKEGQGHWRCRLPVKHLNQAYLAGEFNGVDLHMSDTLVDPDQYDAFVFHRALKPSFIPVLEDLKAKGKKIIWETDDDLFSIPEWNPASKIYNTDEVQRAVKRMIEIADHVIVSTEALKKTIQHPDVTVLPNLIDLDEWPEANRHPVDVAGSLNRRDPNRKIRIVWAGSTHHALDHDLIVEPLERIISEYQDKVQVIFFGDLPDRMAELVQVPFSHLDFAVPHSRYKGNVGLVKLVPIDQFAQTLATLEPDIGLAPLTDVPFNESKSNIKWLEYTMCRAVTIATDCGPYRDITGLTVPHGDKEGWYNALKHVLDDPKERDEIAEWSREDVVKKWSWQHSPRKKDWIEFFERV
jgi:glycosyltransferase involved in cell wall biosynthesis